MVINVSPRRLDNGYWEVYMAALRFVIIRTMLGSQQVDGFMSFIVGSIQKHLCGHNTSSWVTL